MSPLKPISQSRSLRTNLFPSLHPLHPSLTPPRTTRKYPTKYQISTKPKIVGPCTNKSNNVVVNQSYLSKARSELLKLSKHTGAPISSLILSFGILHEVTAIIPLYLFYRMFQFFGVGVGVVGFVLVVENVNSEKNGIEGKGKSSWRELVLNWYDEAERRVDRLGKKYGVLGYDNHTLEDEEIGRGYDLGSGEGVREGTSDKVTNAIAAYVVVKALAPLRITISLALTPSFARIALNPIQRFLLRFRR
ncbi:hypothetical protein TREMEDRAFT_31879 [Tremella mesenterica DSM 1558]|uniref:uncharacterized protein n=1 Tax=Tremella mesenterica (strain ATCC 24925 / CBS 8224 / DSM 1558 / NBRC 9311 / NRRL Y-6157 / RJB 2259-6 / UBC 559-6) TaxID=578456 RepID=UPI0003F497BF|nr:uncharacterized protein TREMEDRAFT_31879 [Tremella mesenterica DSM 1558]EIW68590.1 hypothetical protein TREMEDRAFT_31879 [Tremella mesenterica DSM 1558]